jgi:hypothetical protein
MRAGNWFGHYAAAIQTWHIWPALFSKEGRLLLECGQEFESSARKAVYDTTMLSGGTKKGRK